jgi:hypothetical protein
VVLPPRPSAHNRRRRALRRRLPVRLAARHTQV